MKEIIECPEKIEAEITYSAEGTVWGNLWGGGKGGYAAEHLRDFDSLEALKAAAEEKVKDGSLDSGMGYESLIGAVLNVEQSTVVILNGRRFVSEETEVVVIGDIDEDLAEELLNRIFD